MPGQKVGPYSDVYTFGRTCCEAAFQNPDPRKEFERWPPLYKPLRSLLESCISWQPKDRPQDFGAVLKELEQLEASIRHLEVAERAKQEQELFALQQEGALRLAELVRMIYKRTQGKQTEADKAEIVDLSRRYRLPKKRATTIIDEIKEQYLQARAAEEAERQKQKKLAQQREEARILAEKERLQREQEEAQRQQWEWAQLQEAGPRLELERKQGEKEPAAPQQKEELLGLNQDIALFALKVIGGLALGAAVGFIVFLPLMIIPVRTADAAAGKAFTELMLIVAGAMIGCTIPLAKERQRWKDMADRHGSAAVQTMVVLTYALPAAFGVLGVVLLLVVFLSAPKAPKDSGHTESPPAANKPNETKGKVSYADAGKITVDGKDFTVPDTAKVTIDGKDSKAADIKEGGTAAVTEAEGKITKVVVTSAAVVMPPTEVKTEGKVTFADAGKITVKPTDGAALDFTVNDDKVVMIDGKEGKAADIKVDSTVTVTETDGKITKVDVTSAADGTEVKTEGKITKSDGGKITVKPATGDAKDFTVDDMTLWIDGKEGKAADIKVDSTVTVTATDGKVTKVEVRGPVQPEKGQPFTNSIGMKFVWIEPGSFLMGSPDGKTPPGVPAEKDRSKDESPHQVTLTKSFHMSVYLVTQDQWERVMGKDANRSEFMGKTDDEKKKLPVDNVSWDDCQEFCRKLSALEGQNYTLPSEAQWEYACRAGTKTAYFFGDDPKDLGDYAWYVGNTGIRTCEVGTREANPWGLYDMHGNLWQWCADWYSPYADKGVKDPINIIEGEARVLRGGSWLSNPPRCRAACRYGFAPGSRYNSVGCRVALSPNPSQPPPPPPAQPEKGQPFSNSIGMKFVWIEPGSFLMGSPDGKTPPGVPAEKDRSKDESPHQVTLTKSFHMSVYLVTQDQWERVMGKDANRSEFMGKTDDEKKKLPVDNVSWDDCQEFCRKLSALEGRNYTLPSEAQWEYACRAGTKTAYFFGNDSKLGDYAWYEGNSGKHTHPVGEKKLNPWGLDDMHGNLAQWCEDYYVSYPDSDIKDPINIVKGAVAIRVMRGGSWSLAPRFCRSACRLRDLPGSRDSNRGCRVCLCLD